MNFEIVGIDDHFARRNLRFAGSVITQFADAQALLGPDRRSKDAAGHRSCGIELTSPGHGIENRTKLVVPNLLEALGCLCALFQNTGAEIAGEILFNCLIEARARSRIRNARCGSVASKSESPCCSLSTSSWLIAEMPTQHCVHPSLQTSQSPLRRAASARAASVICTSFWSPGGREVGIPKSYSAATQNIQGRPTGSSAIALTRPICNAPAELTFSAARNICDACPLPMRRGSRWVPPHPVIRPRAAPRCPKMACGPAIRR